MHFKLEEEFSKFFGFTFEGRKYKFNVLPFGWTKSPYYATKFLRPLKNVI